MAGWYLNYVGSVATMILCAWASSNLEAEPQVLTVLFASGTVLAYLQSAFVPLAAYPASQAPQWKIGPKLYLVFAAGALFLYFAIYFGLKWEERGNKEKRVVRGGEEDEALETTRKGGDGDGMG